MFDAYRFNFKFISMRMLVKHKIYDTLGVGFGPSNIALAVACAENGNSSSVQFLEANSGTSWQPGVLIDGSDIQHNPLRDFITPRNPCSPYGYLSYLKSENRLFNFLNLDFPYPPRSDYAKYVQWVASNFCDIVSYSEKVVDISIPCNQKHIVTVSTETGRVFKAHSLCFAPGRSKNVPELFEPFLSDYVIHFTDYSYALKKWSKIGLPKSIAIIGASQSAVEILLDLDSMFDNLIIHSVFRSFSFVLKDTSPFTEDLLFPSHTDYFYNSSSDSKVKLTQQVQRSNYGSVDHDILSKLYYKLYEKKVNHDQSMVIHNNCHVMEVSRKYNQYEILLNDEHKQEQSTILVDAVILATGFRNSGQNKDQELMHPLLTSIEQFYKKNDDGTLYITRNYQLEPLDAYPDLPSIFINGLCESSHGLGDAGSFSLLSYRAFEIEQGLKQYLLKIKEIEQQNSTGVSNQII